MFGSYVFANFRAGARQIDLSAKLAHFPQHRIAHHIGRHAGGFLLHDIGGPEAASKDVLHTKSLGLVETVISEAPDVYKNIIELNDISLYIGFFDAEKARDENTF